jgi:hypothetical protein
MEALIFGAIIIGPVSYLLYMIRAERRRKAKLAVKWVERSPAVSPATPAATSWSKPANQAIGWNVVVIVVGSILALFSWAGTDISDISNNVMRQTVAALWMLCGLIGLLIAAVGLLGATLVHALRYDQ